MIEQAWKKIMRFLKPAQPSAFFNDETLANPYPAYEKPRFQDPVHWDEADERWLLTCYADVVTVLRSPSASSARSSLHALRAAEISPTPRISLEIHD